MSTLLLQYFLYTQFNMIHHAINTCLSEYMPNHIQQYETLTKQWFTKIKLSNNHSFSGHILIQTLYSWYGRHFTSAADKQDIRFLLKLRTCWVSSPLFWRGLFHSWCSVGRRNPALLFQYSLLSILNVHFSILFDKRHGWLLVNGHWTSLKTSPCS